MPAPTPADSADAVTERLTLEDNRVALALYGERNANLKLIERETGVHLHARGNDLTVVGPADNVGVGAGWSNSCTGWRAPGAPISPEDIGRAAIALRADANVDLRDVFQDTILIAGTRAAHRAQGPRAEALRRRDPRARHRRSASARPARARPTWRWRWPSRARREAGQAHHPDAPGGRGGRAARASCPATCSRRSIPYLRPLYDALYDMMDFERADQLHGARHDRGRAARVHARPHAERRVHHPRRGAEHDPEQMKMFLTRLGFGSKAVITGDVTQIDLPDGPPLGADRGARTCCRHRRDRVRLLHRSRRRAPSAGAGDHQGLRRRQVRPRQVMVLSLLCE